MARAAAFLGGGWKLFSPIISFMKILFVNRNPEIHPTEKIKHKETPTISTKRK